MCAFDVHTQNFFLTTLHASSRAFEIKRRGHDPKSRGESENEVESLRIFHEIPTSSGAWVSKPARRCNCASMLSRSRV